MIGDRYYYSKLPENERRIYQEIYRGCVEHKDMIQISATEDMTKSYPRLIHDYLCRNISYDYKGSDTGEVTRIITSHNVLGVFAYKKAQCEGISKAARVLLNAVDVHCIIVFGQAEGNDSVMSDHCWNIINIEGHPYHMDITFDIGNGSDEYIAYDYYNITDTQIRKDHIFSTGLPRCVDKEANYFVQENLVFTSKRKLEHYIAKRINDGAKMLYFKLAGRLKARELSNELTVYTAKVFSENKGGQKSVDMVVNELCKRNNPDATFAQLQEVFHDASLLGPDALAE